MSAGQAKKSTFHLRACCNRKRAIAREETKALERMFASMMRTRGSSSLELVRTPGLVDAMKVTSLVADIVFAYIIQLLRTTFWALVLN